MRANDEHSLRQYLRKRVTRAALSAVISPLARWQPLRQPEPGYTVIIGCSWRLCPMIAANLRFLARQNLTNCRKVIVALDCERRESPLGFESLALKAGAGLPLQFLYYTPVQRRVTRAIGWGWVYSWLNWSLGLAATRTRYAMLHDLDALLLKPSIVEDRYAAIQKAGPGGAPVEFLGVGCYSGLGVRESDGLVKTFELMLDAEFVRGRFRPIDAFNHVSVYKGRRLEFDTFLYIQSLAGRKAVLPIDETEMVHPSQMICHFMDFYTGLRAVPADNNIPLIPYYFDQGGDPSLIESVKRQLNGTGQGDGTVELWGRRLNLRNLSEPLRAWHRKQALRTEAALGPVPRAEVVEYFDAIDRASSVTPPQNQTSAAR